MTMTINFKTAEELVNHLELERHIEGGYFRETYRGKDTVQTPRGVRNSMTNIYYCLPSDDFSVWHKLIDLEETFHFHYGDPAVIYTIANRKLVAEILGPQPQGKPAIIVPANTWFAVRPSGLAAPVPYTLMSCSVIPGFEYDDLVIGSLEILEELDVEEHKLARSLLKISPQ
jgi:predicted cupin superfamily sugar epimerase